MTSFSVKTFAEIEAEKRTGSPYPKCTLWMRLGARAVDLVIAYGIFFFTGQRFGAVLAILFILFADGMIEGQSIGKRIFGIKVVHLPTRASGRKRDSTLRNAPLALPILFWMMPEVGFVAFAAGAAVIYGVETFRVLRDPLGHRFGDVWAETQVVDGKVVAAAGVGVLAHDQQAAVTGRATSRVMFRRAVRRKRRSRCG